MPALKNQASDVLRSPTTMPAMMNQARNSLVLATLALLACAPALALKSDREKQVKVDATTMVANVNQGNATLSGKVVIEQGTMVVRAAKAVITRNDKQELSRAVLTGDPATLSEDLDDGGRLDASAAQIDYDLANNLVVLSGNAVLAQPRGEMRGERITYNLKDGRIDAGGPQGGNRVFLRMNPEPKKPAADTTAKPAESKPAG
jgi:lipopolysaccharide export system protein LptA